MRSSLYSLRWLPVAFAISALTACGDAPTSNPLDVVHAFAGSDGAWSRGSLVSDGTTLFGRTAIGGAANSGTVFRIDGDGAGFAVLYSFSAGGSNVTGNQPHHNAMLLRDGTLIGAALYGGNQDNVQSDPVTGDLTSAAPPPTSDVGNGTLFTIGADGTDYRVLLGLDGGSAAPSLPHSPPALAPDGHTLYGMTASGGTNGSGTLYALDVDGANFRVLRSFATKDGDQPHGVVSFDSSGNLLGMTRHGGTPASGTGAGVIFHYDLTNGEYRVLHTFVADSTTDPSSDSAVTTRTPAASSTPGQRIRSGHQCPVRPVISSAAK